MYLHNLKLLMVCILGMWADILSQEICLFNPLINTTIVDAAELVAQGQKQLKDAFGLMQMQQGLFLYKFNMQIEIRHNDGECSSAACSHAGVFLNQDPLCALSIVGSCIPLIENENKDSALCILTHNYSRKCPIKTSQSYDNHSHEWENAGDYRNNPYCATLGEKDLLIYVIGDDTPTTHPQYQSIKMDADWHGNRINALKTQCKSVMILVAKNRYAEFAQTLIEKCKLSNCDKNTVQEIMAKKNDKKVSGNNYFYSIAALGVFSVIIIGITHYFWHKK